MINNNELQTDVYMTTTHARDRKAKSTFAVMMNKVLVGSLILASLVGGVSMPAMAATSYEPSASITVNYESDLSSILYNITQVSETIKNMQLSGIVTNEILLNLAEQLVSLNSTISISGASASSEVVKVVLNAETIVNSVTKTNENATGLVSVNAALLTAKSEMGITTETTKTITGIQTLSVKATYPTSFTDVKSDNKYYKAITAVAKTGAIGGYSDGTFRPTKAMTNVKFLTILMRAMDSKLSRATKGVDSDSKILDAALKAGIVKATELSASDYNSTITRNNMALWVSRAIEYKTTTDITQLKNVENLVSDYAKIDGSKYKEAVKDLYGLGILSDKSFNATNKVSRGVAIDVIYKVVEKSARANMGKINIPSDSEVKSDRKAITIKWSDKTKTVLPHAGDTFIDKNGKKTVLTSFYWKGHEIVGVKQGVKDLYGNYAYADGTYVKEGLYGVEWDSPNYEYLMSKYVIDDKTGIGLFSVTWKYLADYEMTQAQKVKNPKEGDTYGDYDWCVYTDAFGGSWEWTGPAY